MPAPPPPPVCTWCGWYGGLNVGGTWANDNSISVFTVPVSTLGGLAIADGNAAAASATGRLSGRNVGLIGGAQLGYNWQSGSWVTGIETDIQASGHGDSLAAGNFAVVGPGGLGIATGTPDVTTFIGTKVLEYMGTVRGRLGVTVSPTLLAYATGGFAYGGVSTSAGFTTVNGAYPPLVLGAPAFSPNWGTSASTSATRIGWTLGGGLEWMFTRHLSAKAEYLYYDLGNLTYALGQSGVLFLPVAALLFTNASTATTRFNGSIARVGANYKF
jgi:outer membrane immunogenic protein